MEPRKLVVMNLVEDGSGDTQLEKVRVGETEKVALTSIHS